MSSRSQKQQDLNQWVKSKQDAQLVRLAPELPTKHISDVLYAALRHLRPKLVGWIATHHPDTFHSNNDRLVTLLLDSVEQDLPQNRQQRHTRRTQIMDLLASQNINLLRVDRSRGTHNSLTISKLLDLVRQHPTSHIDKLLFVLCVHDPRGDILLRKRKKELEDILSGKSKYYYSHYSKDMFRQHLAVIDRVLDWLDMKGRVHRMQQKRKQSTQQQQQQQLVKGVVSMKDDPFSRLKQYLSPN